jgi:hypothetical protein
MPDQVLPFPLVDEQALELVKPVAEDSSGATPPENSEIRKIAEDVLNAAKFTFVAVTALPTETEVRPNTLEGAFKEALSLMDAPRRDRIVGQAMQLVHLEEPAKQHIFGRYAHIDKKSFLSNGFSRMHEALPPLQIDTKLLGINKTPVLAVPPGAKLQVTSEGLLIPKEYLPKQFKELGADREIVSKAAARSGVYNAQRLAEIWGQVSPMDSMHAETRELERQVITNKLGFYITRVKCVDETGLSGLLGELGGDEIALAGVSVDETGDTLKIDEQSVDDGFDDGDEKVYSPHWKYHYFNLLEGTHWPKFYMITLILAEKDEGGLSDVLNRGWVKIKDRVDEEIKRAVEAGTELFVGPVIGPVIAEKIADAAAWIVDRLIEWIIDAFKDDIFPAYVAKTKIPSFSARWHYPNGQWGSPTSPLRKADFYGHHGHYYIEYYWRLYS